MTLSRLEQQIAFISEIDKLKTILRQTPLMDNSRRENSAEHSWHLAVMALTLAEYAEPGTDITRVVKMVLIHDIVEIDAGDTFAYDTQGYVDKADREELAAARIFGLLPDDIRDSIMALWREFEAIATPEARFANALDRLEPLIGNFAAGGGSWKKAGVNLPKVQKRMEPIGAVSPALGEYVQHIIAQAVERGYILES
ncbi:MAG: HD domain-containing protein [Chloroflexi bacterium]|nr:HD domain-containing protein [Chloroflexota bacterium]MCC6894190.1 HD domain-containing protein [Anaerolineae bacterium]